MAAEQEVYTGIVQRVHNKGNRWSLLMDDDNWYGNGFKEPVGVLEGSTVRFSFEMNGKYHNILDGTLQHKKGEVAPVETKKKAYGGKTDYAKKEKYWADKELRDIDNQKRISYQAATNTALATVTAAANLEIIKLSGKKADQFDAFVAMVAEEAENLFRIYNDVPANFEDIMAGGYSEEKEEVPEGVVSTEESDGGDDEWET